MIEFDDKGMRAFGFGSGQGSTRGRTIRFQGSVSYPDSSDTLRFSGVRPGTCARCKRRYIAGPGYEYHCKRCHEATA